MLMGQRLRITGNFEGVEFISETELPLEYPKIP